MKLMHTFVGLMLGWQLLGTAQAQLLIGQPSGFTGSVAAGVKENTEGAALYFDAINANGGINGQQIQLISVDDKFLPENTLTLARELIVKRSVLALFLNRGTPHAQALMPLLAEFKVPLVAPSSGAMVLHKPVNPWVFNVRATYQREAAKAVEHLFSVGVTRLGVMQTDDSFGADGAEGALKALEKLGKKAVFVTKFARETPDFAPLVKQAISTDAQAVMIIGSAGNTANAVKALRAGDSLAQVITLSNNASEGFIKLLGEQGHGVIVTQAFPNERAIVHPLVKEARSLAKAKGLAGVSPAMLEGFAAAKVLVEALRRAGPNPTRESLVAALNKLKFDIGGFEVAYSSTDHTGLDFADLSIISSDGRFMR